MMRWVMILLAACSSCLCAQLKFSSVPYDFQFFARDEKGHGQFTVTGSCNDLLIRDIDFTLIRNCDSSLVSFKRLSPPATKEFSVPFSIRAEICDYSLEIAAIGYDGQKQIQKTVNRLVAGDVFLVAGQSNAESSPFGEDWPYYDSVFRNPYCRALGQNHGHAMQHGILLLDDSKCALPSGFAGHQLGYGFAGSWPLAMQHRLAQLTGIPVCIVNAGVGGTRISEQFPVTRGSDISLEDSALVSGIYDRAYAKLYKSGLASSLKAIFWYQGESDGNFNLDTAFGYPAQFQKLRSLWKSDYPSLEKIYMFQINTGCGGEHLEWIREIQSSIAKNAADVEIMSTVGAPPDHRHSDNCHYSSKGSIRLAEIMAPLVAKQLYGISFPDDSVFAPFAERIYFSDYKTICVQFDRDVLIQEEFEDSSGKLFLKDYFSGEYGQPLPVTAVTAKENNVFLHLDKEGYGFAYLSHPPGIFSKTGLYSGPWILNKRNPAIGALAFHSRFIEPLPQEFSPNPTTGRITLHNLKGAIIEVFDISGKLMLSAKASDEFANSIDISELNDGLYLLRVSGNRPFRKKIVLKRD
jgi:hypothetical protein